MSPNHHIVSWLDCFTTHATELVKLSIYKGILDNSRNWQFRKWTAQHMKGTLICTNPICENNKANIGKKKKKNPDSLPTNARQILNIGTILTQSKVKSKLQKCILMEENAISVTKLIHFLSLMVNLLTKQC